MISPLLPFFFFRNKMLFFLICLASNSFDTLPHLPCQPLPSPPNTHQHFHLFHAFTHSPLTPTSHPFFSQLVFCRSLFFSFFIFYFFLFPALVSLQPIYPTSSPTQTNLPTFDSLSYRPAAPLYQHYRRLKRDEQQKNTENHCFLFFIFNLFYSLQK